MSAFRGSGSGSASGSHSDVQTFVSKVLQEHRVDGEVLMAFLGDPDV